MPRPMLLGRNCLGRIPARPGRVHVAKATVTGDHIRPAFLDRAIVAIPYYVAGADRHHRAPWTVSIGPAGGSIKAQCHYQGRDCEHKAYDSFHRDSPDD